MSEFIGPVDIALLIVLVISIIVGLLRGLLFEVLSLSGWVAAYIAAQVLAPIVAPHVPVGAPGSGINQAAAFVIIFIAALIVWALAARLIRMLVRASPLSALDRVLGGGFGLLRGIVLLLALTTVVALTPMARSVAWQSSKGASWLTGALQALKPVLPHAVARHLP
jgi:membrane protein required for colicin V production